MALTTVLLSLGEYASHNQKAPSTHNPPATASLASAEYTGPGGPYGPGGRYAPDRFGPGGFGSGGGDGSNNYNNYNNGPSSSNRGGPSQAFMNHSQKALLAHGILASLAFVLFFPMGAILIRLGSFRGVWLIHGIFQLVAYIVYTAAFGLGVWMVQNLPVNLLTHAHPIIGILVFALLFFQPLLGFIHHVQFKKYARRTLWSHAHVWLGRIAVTLGIVNGGLGLLLASDAPAFTRFRPDQRQIAAYSVVAAFMWLLWVAAAVVGERRRGREARRQADEEALAVARAARKQRLLDETRISKDTYH